MTSIKNKGIIKRNPIFLIVDRFLKVYIIIGFLLRVILMLTAPADASFSFVEVLRCIGLGILPILVQASFFLFLFLCFILRLMR